MTSKDIIKRLEAEGWVLSHAKGSHFQFTQPQKPGRVTVPHPKKVYRSARYVIFTASLAGTGDPDMRYPVVIHKDKASDYGVTVPDLPGCFSAGDTMEDALVNVVEAIECHLEGLLFDGEVIPEAQSVEVHQKNKDFRGVTWALVNVDLSRLASKAKRINITLPERVLALVDEQAKREGESRSGLLARAVLDYIGRNKVA